MKEKSGNLSSKKMDRVCSLNALPVASFCSSSLDGGTDSAGNYSEYAQVTKMLGNGRLEAQCFDGEKRLAHIRGKMRKKVIINAMVTATCLNMLHPGLDKPGRHHSSFATRLPR